MPNGDSSEELRILAERINKLELRVTELEQLVSHTSSSPSSKESTSKIEPPIMISAEILQKSFHAADYSLGDAGDRIDFAFRFKNHFPKDVRAFEGLMVFRDLFNKVILQINLTNEETVLSGKTVEWRGGIEYNQFMPEHQRLSSINIKDLSIDFVLRNVIFTDGTRESFENRI
jgi:hypothetical protein